MSRRLVWQGGALVAVLIVGMSATVGSSTVGVSCSDIIGQARGPRVDGYRLVLGVLSVPPAYLAQGAVPVDGGRRWTHWHKAGVVVRSGTFTVTVTVLEEWRRRVAITWGNDGPVVSSLAFSGCGKALPRRWNAYAGGFYLRAPRACVPLAFSVDTRSTIVRFGIGRRCP